MSKFDLLVKQSLENSWQEANIEVRPRVTIGIPFGHVAFIKESSWKTADFFQKAKEHRSSHPGLSISKNPEFFRVAFGSSQTHGRNPSDRSLFYVKPEDCQCLKLDTVFLLKSTHPVTIFSIDDKFGGSASLSQKKLAELKKKLKS